MYDNIKFWVLYNDKQSHFVFLYDWCQATRERFPLLFFVFLNDLEDYLKNLAEWPL